MKKSRLTNSQIIEAIRRGGGWPSGAGLCREAGISSADVLQVPMEVWWLGCAVDGALEGAAQDRGVSVRMASKAFSGLRKAALAPNQNPAGSFYRTDTDSIRLRPRCLA